MPPIDPDYLKQRSEELGLDRAEILKTVQAKLDQMYPGRSHAISLNQGVLKIITESAPVASELRLRQTEIIATSPAIESLQIVIG